MGIESFVVVGAGIVGLATAYQLGLQYPDARISVLEKESEPALHQTGRNSGVIHSGVYYPAGSVKALTCVAGRRRLLEFCDQNEIPYQLCGKVIVATETSEIERLKDLYERGQANGVSCQMLSVEELRDYEPHARGVAALYVADAGIINYRAVCARLRQRMTGRVYFGAEVISLSQDLDDVVIVTTKGRFRAQRVINCAGLHCDRVARTAGAAPRLQIVPFKGEYFRVRESAHHLCRSLIYPVPNPQFPFLGVHLTRTIDGGLEVGPNAVLAGGREAYGRTDINLADLSETLRYSGFLRLAGKHWRMGLGEIHRSLSKRAFVKELRKLCPDLKGEDLLRSPSGIRAQALRSDGSLVGDFELLHQGRILHVLNAPSPAATASLAIAQEIVERIISS